MASRRQTSTQVPAELDEPPALLRAEVELQLRVDELAARGWELKLSTCALCGEAPPETDVRISGLDEVNPEVLVLRVCAACALDVDAAKGSVNRMGWAFVASLFGLPAAVLIATGGQPPTTGFGAMLLAAGVVAIPLVFWGIGARRQGRDVPIRLQSADANTWVLEAPSATKALVHEEAPRLLRLP